MSKSILLALLAVAGIVIGTNDAYARCGRQRCCRSNCGFQTNNCCASSCGQSSCNSGCNTGCNTGCSSGGCGAGGCQASAPMTTATPVTGSPTPVVANSNSSYQSFSYEPGSSQPVTTTAPVMTYQTYTPMNNRSYSEYDSVLRGNKKVMNPRF